MVQYKVAYVITGAIKETSRDRVYQELGLEFLADRRCSCRRFLLPENYTEALTILSFFLFFHIFLYIYFFIFKLTIMLLGKERI